MPMSLLKWALLNFAANRFCWGFIITYYKRDTIQIKKSDDDLFANLEYDEVDNLKVLESPKDQE